MPNHNPKAKQLITEYIAKSPEFAQKICNKLRHIILRADPNIIEDWKWGPNYYKNGMVCGYGAFKGWVTFTFFQGALMKDTKQLFNYGDANAHNRSIKLTDVSEINESVLTSYLKEAIKINESGTAVPLSYAKDKTIAVPKDFKEALEKAKKLEKFEKLPYAHRKEYVVWIEDAKKEETRARRIEKAIKMIE